ncbi:aminotransferase class III-fold pyridoxal phosphate-dependent enzyme [Pseudomonas sp. Sample_24]|jgi:acetylornithine aminotransferase/putrescine aminotransferase|uniref:aminotransferase class III-fold pyridoxal phosphate-dependent enzyme n=1 Tax=Pseudomonas sp. Sample_24 TaxID=2448268 RepID=UPI001032BC94|nr:aminotransferase class III-fold pyridoxal phosphate-dependent enzyme [Pseudomonas sp. Sample_24]
MVAHTNDPGQTWAVKGQYESFIDNNGHHLIDLSGGFGLQVPEVVNAVSRQIDKIGLSNRVLLSAPLIQLCKQLSELMPEGLENSYVCNSGDEAFEGALKLARSINPHRRTIISVGGVAHGSLSYGRYLSAPHFYPQLGDFLGIKVVHVHSVHDLPDKAIWQDCFALCYGPLRTTHDGLLEAVEPTLIASLERIANSRRIPTLFNDVDTCLGSVGHLLSQDLSGARPDIVVLGKSLGGGCIPIGTYTCSHALAYKAYGKASPAKHGSTTAGNPPSCIAAQAALNHVRDHRLDSRTHRNGTVLAAELADFNALAIGGIVKVPLNSIEQAFELQQSLYTAGVHIRRPGGPELLLRCPLVARTERVVDAARIIKRTLEHAA